MLLRNLRMLQMLMANKALAEIIGTFTMIFVGGGSILLVDRFPQTFPAFIIPITWGTIIALMIVAMGHISEAHMNPAVTLAFGVAKQWPLERILIYWGSQFTGGLVAIGVLQLLRKI